MLILLIALGLVMSGCVSKQHDVSSIDEPSHLSHTYKPPVDASYLTEYIGMQADQNMPENILPYLSNTPQEPKVLSLSEPKRQYDQLDINYFENTGFKPNADGSCPCEGKNICPGKEVPKIRATHIAPSKGIGVAPKAGFDRYYFIRSCDTPESVAMILYGSTGRSSELATQVRGGAWSSGKLLYYKSTNYNQSNPFLSFYEDQSSSIQEYVVKSGDNLASIAYQMTGDARNWTEIAHRNKLKSPDHVFVGQKLVVDYRTN